MQREALKMTFHPTSRRALPWLVLAGLVAALAIPTIAAAKPIPATSTPTVLVNGDRVPLSQLSAYQQASAGQGWQKSQLIQIGGQLVTPAQLSAWQARAHQAPMPASQLLQIGGQLVKPSQASAVQSGLGSSTRVASSSSGDGFNWSALSAGIGGFVLLLGASAFVLRSRRRIAATA
jgi:hypothetical protein